MNINYQKELDKIIDELVRTKQVSTLLLHSCCAPCSSYCLEYLANFFKITIFYYNPNIFPEEEYEKRVVEQQMFIQKLPTKYPVSFLSGNYDTKQFYDMVKGYETEPEGGERCFRCYELRLREAAIMAKEKGFDYFTTTLSISPHKNAMKLNEIGQSLAKQYEVSYLPSDFKKKNGFKRSTELAKEYDLYRQDYCGCAFSKRMNEEKEESKGTF